MKAGEIRALRKRLNWTQRRLADAIGCSWVTVNGGAKVYHSAAE